METTQVRETPPSHLSRLVTFPSLGSFYFPSYVQKSFGVSSYPRGELALLGRDRVPPYGGAGGTPRERYLCPNSRTGGGTSGSFVSPLPSPFDSTATAVCLLV